jgi:hypothetical protein
MMLYSAAWIAVPSIVLTLSGAHFLMVLAIQTVGLFFGLTFGLLPRMFLILAGLAPSLLGLMHFQLHYPGKPAVLLLWLVAAALVFISALCWRRQVRLTNPYGEGFNKPLVLRTRAGCHTGFTNWSDWTARSAGSRQIRSRPQWMLAIADLRDTGPHNPVRSLRIGLGGWTLPKTWLSASRQWLLVLSPIILFAAILYLRFMRVVPGLFRTVAFSLNVWITGFGSVLVALMTVATLQQRWSRTNAELPLLALLPQLGDGEWVKKHLLRASLLPTFFWQAFFIALLLATSLVMQGSYLTLATAVLIQIVAIAFSPAFAFAILGGRPPAHWVAGLIACIGFTSVGCSTAVSNLLEISGTYGSTMAISIIAILLAALAFLVWLGVRGWRGLQERAHPFLAN